MLGAQTYVQFLRALFPWCACLLSSDGPSTSTGVDSGLAALVGYSWVCLCCNRHVFYRSPATAYGQHIREKQTAHTIC